MALTDEGTSTTMLVSPTGICGNGGFGFGDGNGWWILLLFILMGGWGNGFGGGFDGGLYPWMNNSQNINNGFRDQMLGNQINGIQNSITSGFGDVQTALCGGFAGITNTMNQNTMADMERSFAVQSALQNCCCENRAATADLKYTVATENCADRAAAAQNTRDIIDSQNRGTQAILDKLCALELDGYKRENDNLRSQLNMASLAASQANQNTLIQKGFADEVDALYNRLSNCPVPSTPVYGRTPIFTCGGNTAGCGCGA